MYMYMYMHLHVHCTTYIFTLALCVLAQLERELVLKEQRVREMEDTLSSLDREHDTLRSEVDLKDETIQQLQHQLTEKV